MPSSSTVSNGHNRVRACLARLTLILFLIILLLAGGLSANSTAIEAFPEQPILIQQRPVKMVTPYLFTTTALSLLGPLVTGHLVDGSSNCKNIPGDSLWPGDFEWSALNKTLGGRLVASVPLAAVCHHEPFNIYDEERCNAAKEAWDRPETHFVEPVEFNAPIFQNATCDPFTSVDEKCELGNYVSYAVNLTTDTAVGDVKAGLDFATKHNIRVVIKNTGHDYLGKSTGKGALSFWTHNLKNISIVENYASDNYNGAAVKVGAGVQGFDALVPLKDAGYLVLPGSCPTVGFAGGYTQGGGHSIMASKYGLSADNVLEWEVVTANGTLVIATPKDNQDLYFALSGGGGGTFGVVLSMTTRLFPDRKIGGANNFTFAAASNKDEDVNAFWDAVGSLQNLSIPFTDAGNSLLYLIYAWPDKNVPALTTYSVTIPDCDTTDCVDTVMKPFTDDLTARGVKYGYSSKVSESFLEHYNASFGPMPYGWYPVSQVTGGRLLPRAVVSDETMGKNLTATMRMAIQQEGFTLGCVALNAKVGLRDGVVSSVNPAWRDAMAFCLIVGKWDYLVDREEMMKMQKSLTEVVQPAIDAATPGGGCYLNEANFEHPDWQAQFYGLENYKNLRNVKDKWDSTGVFYATTAVGSEDCEIDGDGRVCKKQ
ncbi:putative oxidase [Triangularia setosa]|uniref:Oxidase n=1 Tax=Triangularia setosa TaxID=2587417 RepID=A0AAN7A8I1_9PEZI|nr:putative oxidase [Podospora setosa]